MKSSVKLIAFVLLPILTMAQLKYPETQKTDQTDNYHGTEVKDPYRWLEDDKSAETAAWVKAQNEVTFDYLSKIPYRKQIRTGSKKYIIIQNTRLHQKSTNGFIFTKMMVFKINRYFIAKKASTELLKW